MAKVAVVSAFVAQANTPDTDKMEFVLHTIIGCTESDPKNSLSIEVFARCPLDAIERVRDLDSTNWTNIVV